MTSAMVSESQPAQAGETKATRIWLLTNCPSPYQVELLAELSQRDDIELDVRFMQGVFRDDQPPERLRDLSHQVLRSFGVLTRRDEFRLHPAAIREVSRAQHDVYVLSGLYTSPTFLLCALLLSFRKRRYTLWLERPSDANRPDLNWWKRVLRTPFVWYRAVVLRLLLWRCERTLCMGTLAAQQYAQYGLSSTRTEILPYCCDTDRFSTVNQTARDELADSLGVRDRMVFLFSGQLIYRKGIDTALQAFQQVSENVPGLAFVVLGDGPLRAQLEEQFGNNPHGRVVFAGHQPQDRLPLYFAVADVFVLPSRQDGWAVVVNEACAAGLPIIASQQTGAAHDLVIPERNGFRPDCRDIDGLVDAMRTLAGDASLRERYGRESLELVEDFTVECGAQRFAAAVQKAVTP